MPSLDQRREPQALRPPDAPSRRTGEGRGSEARSSRWDAGAAEVLRHRPDLLDRRSVLALQRAAGNAAVAAAIQRIAGPDGPAEGDRRRLQALHEPARAAAAPLLGSEPVVQRGRSKKKIKRLQTGLRAGLTVAMKNCRGPSSNKAFKAFSKLWALVGEEEPTLAELNRFEAKFHLLRHKHAAALQLGAPPHPSGLADSGGNLQPPHDTQQRTLLYPTGYNATALQAKTTWMANHPGGTPGTTRCPGHGAQGPHDVATGTMTIDHVTPVASHWNATGRFTTRAVRIAFFNDHTNHEYLCLSCNASKGSGQVYYRKKVGPNFTN